MVPFLLIILGLILILLEFYLPGGIVGILGGLAILLGIFLFASQTSSIMITLLFVLLVVVVIVLSIRLTLQRISHAKSPYSICSKNDQEGYQASCYDQTAIGKKGIVIADLKPGGYILIEERQHPAISINSYIPKGEHVIVLGGQEQNLFVQMLPK